MKRTAGNGKVLNFLKGANKFLRNTKIISRYGDYIPVIGNTVSKVAGVLGYGRRRRTRGGSFFGKLKAWNNKLREGKYISKYGKAASNIVRTIGNVTGNTKIQRAANIASNISNKAGVLGYGIRGGRRLAINGMGRPLSQQEKTQRFCQTKLAMI